MTFSKICMECGKMFETKLFNDYECFCPHCNCADIANPDDEVFAYSEATLEDCFCLYYEQGVISEFDADKKEIICKKEV